MRPEPTADVYTPAEIAQAAGVPVAQVLDALERGTLASDADGLPLYLAHADAVRLGRYVVAQGRASRPSRVSSPLFSTFGPAKRSTAASRSVPLAVSSALHIGCLALVMFVAALGLTPQARTFNADPPPNDRMHLIFLATPGPGGGGGGGGLQQPAPPPKAMREGHDALSSPLPKRVAPRRVVETPKPPEPKPPIPAEHLPPIIAPIVTAPADATTRAGVLEQTSAQTDSRGPGRGGGAGRGTGTGLGEGDGPGVGSGSGGGTGGGPYRAGSGIEPPRVLREVKADYTEDARRRNLEGDVVLEIVVRNDGSVGDVKVTQGLAGGLNERAVDAVRQWRFAPARRLGAPVDVIVEVAVEFKLR